MAEKSSVREASKMIRCCIDTAKKKHLIAISDT